MIWRVPTAALNDGDLSAHCEAPAVEFSAVYSTHFHEVCRWLHAMGGPDADLEDLAQEVFLVVRRRLDGFDGRNLRGWLYRIAQNVARVHRRRLFFRSLFSRRYGESLVIAPRHLTNPPDRHLEEQDARRIAEWVLSRMTAAKRTAFVLYEIEGYDTEDIARLENVPEATVRTRLFHARREFRALLRKVGPPHLPPTADP
jgi:RNA polymerase sigma-70 factor, ECF subfamily